MALLINELDLGFKYDVSHEPGGGNIKQCFACGLCTASCPVSDIDPDYNPRRIIRMVLLGMREKVLSGDFIWLCLQCYTCQAHCPQNVNFSNVMKALRCMAVREGYVHALFPGKVKEIDLFIKKQRHDMVISIVGQKTTEIKKTPGNIAVEILHKGKSE